MKRKNLNLIFCFLVGMFIEGFIIGFDYVFPTFNNPLDTALILGTLTFLFLVMSFRIDILENELKWKI